MAGPKKSKKKPKSTPTAAASPTPSSGEEFRPMVVTGSGGGAQSGGLAEPDPSPFTTGTPTPKPKAKATPSPDFREEASDAYPDLEGIFRAGQKEGVRKIKDAVEKDIDKVKKSFQHTQGDCLCGKKHGEHELDMRKTCWCGKSGPHNVGIPR